MTELSSTYEPPGMTRRAANGQLTLLVGLALAGALVQIVLLFPGQVYSDGFDQYQQALSGDLNDWHPPIMALFWRLQMQLLHTSAAYYMLNIAGYWAALVLVLRNWPAWFWRSAVLLLAGFCPPIAMWLGVTYKDVAMLSAVALAAALMFDAALRERELHPVLRWGVVGLLLYASLLRTNAPFLTAPLIALVLLGWPRRLSWRWLAAGAICVALLAVSPFVNDQVMGARNAHSIRSLQIFDIAGISALTGQNLFPGPWDAEAERKIVNDCYIPVYWDTYSFGRCEFVYAALKDRELTASWVSAIAAHPLAYAYHRLLNWNSFLRLAGDLDAFNYFLVSGPGIHSDEPPQVTAWYQWVVGILRGSPKQLWFMPYFWTGLAAALFVLTARGDGRLERTLNAGAAGATIYVIADVVVNVGSEYRYVLPTAAVVLVGLLALLVRVSRDGVWPGTPITRTMAGVTLVAIVGGGLVM